MRWLVRALGVASLVAGVAHADDTHYQDFVVGGRAVGMGGAYTSIADDPSGLYYNPAGLADNRSSNLQVSTSLYGFERGSIEGKLPLPVPGVENLDIQFTDLIIIPASAGFVKTFGAPDVNGHTRDAFGFSVVVPSFRSFAISSGDDYRSYQRRVTDRELWTGIGYARRLTSSLRLGISGYYVLRSINDSEAVTAREPLSNGEEKFQTVSNDISLLAGSVVFVAGAKYTLGNHWSFGASIQSPSAQIHSRGTLRFVSAESDPDADGGPQSNLETPPLADVKVHNRRSLTARLGASYNERHKYTLSADVSAHAPVEYTLAKVDDSISDRLPFNSHIVRNPVVNFNLGGEVLLVREVSISGGLFSDFSSAGSIPKNPTEDLPPKVDLLGLTMAIGYFGEHTLSRLGVLYSFGKGHDVIPASSDVDRLIAGGQSYKRVEYTQSFFYVFLSSTFRY